MVHLDASIPSKQYSKTKETLNEKPEKATKNGRGDTVLLARKM